MFWVVLFCNDKQIGMLSIVKRYTVCISCHFTGSTSSIVSWCYGSDQYIDNCTGVTQTFFYIIFTFGWSSEESGKCCSEKCMQYRCGVRVCVCVRACVCVCACVCVYSDQFLVLIRLAVGPVTWWWLTIMKTSHLMFSPSWRLWVLKL